jgi:RNA polymerase sigma-70 factor (ECF subfamily)
MKDSEIISRFAARDEQAIRETSAKFGGLCRHIAANVLSSREDVDECLNDTWLAAWNTIPPAQPESLSAYLGKTVRNLALKKAEYNSSQKRGGANAAVSMTELEDFLPHGVDLADEVEARETAKYVSGFLRTLSFADRNVFLRKYFVGDSLAQIGELFGFSESKVKSSLHRTRSKLKKELIKKGVLL